MKTYNCLNCGKECNHSYSKKNKFCDNVCQGEYRWKHDTKPRIERGECAEPITLRKYLIEVVGDTCAECGNGNIWQGKPITLHVDHIDGNSDNNHVLNLRLLCPNCHSQTPTFGSRGIGNRYRKHTKRATYRREYRDREVDALGD